MFVHVQQSIVKNMLPTICWLLLLVGISVGLSFTTLTILQSFRIVFGSVFLLFLPGYIWSFVFWKKKEIDFIERFALSLALSLTLVPLIVYTLNRIGVRITLWNSIIEISGLILVGIFLLFLLNRLAEKRSRISRPALR